MLVDQRLPLRLMMKISQQRQVLNGAGDLKKAVLPHNSPGGVRIYLKSLFIQFRASPVSSASAPLHIQNQGATWQVFPQYSPLVSSSYLGFKLTNRFLQPKNECSFNTKFPMPRYTDVQCFYRKLSPEQWQIGATSTNLSPAALMCSSAISLMTVLNF